MLPEIALCSLLKALLRKFHSQNKHRFYKFYEHFQLQDEKEYSFLSWEHKNLGKNKLEGSLGSCFSIPTLILCKLKSQDLVSDSGWKMPIKSVQSFSSFFQLLSKLYWSTSNHKTYIFGLHFFPLGTHCATPPRVFVAKMKITKETPNFFVFGKRQKVSNSFSGPFGAEKK